MNESNRYFSQKLKDLRHKSGHTQKSLSEKLLISRPMIGAYEEGRCQPSLEKLSLFADFFGVSIDDLVRNKKAAAT